MEIKENELQTINGKWVAVLLKGKRTGESELIRDDGIIVADEDLNLVQMKADELYPELNLYKNNTRGRLVKYGYVPKKMIW